jgi:hypothetical protein
MSSPKVPDGEADNQKDDYTANSASCNGTDVCIRFVQFRSGRAVGDCIIRSSVKLSTVLARHTKLT